jgi:hypothetical protein
VQEPHSVQERASAILPAMRSDAYISHATAAQLWGIPLPSDAERPTDVHVTVPVPANRPRGDGVVGHRTRIPARVTVRNGLPVSTPERTWVDLASSLDVGDLVAAGDHLVCRTNPLSSLAALAAELRRAGRIAGKAKLLEAMTLIRPGSDSPRETRTRLAIVDGGLPEPRVNARVELTGGQVFYLDLSYPELKIAVEYEGLHHQENRQVYLCDIDRREVLQRAGWTIVLIVREHLDHPELIVSRVARALSDACAA